MRKTPQTVVRGSFVGSKRYDNVSAQPEHIIKVKVAARLRGPPVDGDVLNVHRRAWRDCLLRGFGIVVDSGDSCADVKVGVVDGVLGYEGREDDVLRC